LVCVAGGSVGVRTGQRATPGTSSQIRGDDVSISAWRTQRSAAPSMPGSSACNTRTIGNGINHSAAAHFASASVGVVHAPSTCSPPLRV
jgi:hypothetical protein